MSSTSITLIGLYFLTDIFLTTYLKIGLKQQISCVAMEQL